jgi:NADPH-dependent 2,4-dienoyl-CoA reductase/sulfur reductase-like enzyme
VTRSLQAGYLVVGAGAMGMAFTDALIDHADVHVTLVHRQPRVGPPSLQCRLLLP